MCVVGPTTGAVFSLPFARHVVGASEVYWGRSAHGSATGWSKTLHMGNKHDKFIQERWQEFSNFQKNYAGKAQQDHEELGDAKPESSTNHTDVNESSLAAEKTKPNG